jgi:hypothetical protein
VPDFNDNLVQGNVTSRGGAGDGGGVYAEGYFGEARRNTIVGNTATNGGGVYFAEYPHPQTFSDNLVARNQATGVNVGAQDGGGGISSAADRIEIIGNDILSNTALAGGGIRVTAGRNYVLQDNVFAGNWAVAGGGAYVYSATGTIVQNQFVGNRAEWWGGGLYLTGRASPTLDRNVVMSNTAVGIGGFAGGGIIVGVESSTRVTLTNHVIANNMITNGVASGIHCMSGSCALIHCTIVDNKQGGAPGEGVRIGAMGGTNLVWNSVIAGHSTGVVVGGGVTAVLNYDDYYGNTTPVSGTGEGATHYDFDPQFVDRAGGDYHLAEGSPLIGLGDGGLSASHDLDGDLRLAAPDIGADEYVPIHVYLPAVMRGWSGSGEG